MSNNMFMPVKGFKYLTAGFVMMMLLIGCGSSQSQEKAHYVLQPSAHNPQPLPVGTAVVAIRSVALPRYLNQYGIARQINDEQITLSYYETWAEKLSEAIPPFLVQGLSNALGKPVEKYPLPPGTNVPTSISVNIENIIANSKQLHISASYRITKGTRFKSYRFVSQVNLDAPYDTQSIVHAHRIAIKRLASDIKRHLAP